MALKANNGQTNGVTAVAMMNKVGVDARVNGITVVNLDTEDALVVLRVRSPFGGSTFRSIRQVTLAKGVLATQLITHGLPLDGETVVINGKTYTYQATLTEGDGNVKLTASAATTATNLLNAINDSGGTKGTDYATANVVDRHVNAVANGANIDVNAKFMGAGANKISIDVTDATNVTVGAATLVGGVDPSVLEYNTPIGLKDDDRLEIVLGRAVITTELDWTVSYDE